MTFDCRSSKIRIWIHQRDLHNLQKVLWEGYGDRLKTETSADSKVRKFLESVPYLMKLIQNIHQAVIRNDLDKLIELTSDPVPSIIFSNKDLNGLTALHKAVGLGHREIAEYIISRYPESVNIVDNDKRTPLFYSILRRDNLYMYHFLLDAGSNESHLDIKRKTAAYYMHRNNEIPEFYLRIIPDAPRTATVQFPVSWNWSLIRTESAKSTSSSGGGATMRSERKSAPQDPVIRVSQHDRDLMAVCDDDDDDNDEKVVFFNEMQVFGDKIDIHTEVTISEDSQSSLNESDLIEILNEGNLEELANIVLSGDGDRLINKQSTNVQSQEFINNVPVYMEKIKRIHKSARNGEFNELQLALDRRKFAIACDKISPKKTTPLHVAIIFGHVKIIKYLCGKFPETLQAEDIDGRVPLHYAAVINDNKYLYNLLINHGANATVEDNFNKIAEYYQYNQEMLSHKILLTVFNASEKIDDLLSDKAVKKRFSKNFVKKKTVPNDTVTSKRDLDDEIVLNLLDQCFNIISDRRHLMKNSTVTTNSTPSTSRSSSLVSHQNYLPFGNLVYKHLRRHCFETIKYRVTCLDHCLYDIVWPVVKKIPKSIDFRSQIEQDLYGGVFAPDQYVYRTFREFFDPFLKDLHFISFDVYLKSHPASSFFNRALGFGGGTAANEPPTEADFDEQLNDGRTPKYHVDKYGKNIIYSKLSLSRNLKSFQFPKSLSMKDLETVEIVLLEKLFHNKMTEILVPDKNLNQSDENVLGEPLIKGLAEIAYKKPPEPLGYLANFLKSFANVSKKTKTESLTPTITVRSGQKTKSAHTDDDAKSIISNGLIDTFQVKKAQFNQNNEDINKNMPPNHDIRDEHGQTILHFTVSKAQNRNLIFQLLTEMQINIGFRDELYRTARDISVESNIPENTKEIDKYIIYLSAKSDFEKLLEIMLEGYEHIYDVMDENGKSVYDIVQERELTEVRKFLRFVPIFQKSVKEIHNLIRHDGIDEVIDRLSSGDRENNRLIVLCKNSYGRCTLHIAILLNKIRLVDFLAKTFPDVVHIGDNLERTPLHYAMGVNQIEKISELLIQVGADRLRKDLKGRQACYYFMNQSDIVRLKEEEQFLLF